MCNYERFPWLGREMYARGAKLIVDEDDVELEISNPDYN